MSNLALSFGIGIVLGIILFFILERVGVLQANRLRKWWLRFWMFWRNAKPVLSAWWIGWACLSRKA